MLSKTKKRKKRKKEKKKNLPLISKKYIKDNQCWIPNIEDGEDYSSNIMNSWFDINCTHETPNKPMSKIESKTFTTRVKRVELYPTDSQKTKLLKWMEVYRRVYNLVIANKTKYIKNNNMKSYYTIRQDIKENILLDNKILVKEINDSNIPAHTLWNAVNDVTKAFKTAKANKDAGNIKSFRLRYKRLDNHLRTLVLEPGTFSKKYNSFAVKVLGNEIKSSEPFNKITKECRLSYNFRTDKFVLCVPYTKFTSVTTERNDIISLDPGIKTFQTGYSPDGICYKFATYETNHKLKNLLERINNVVYNEKYRKKGYKKFLKRAREKVTNMVADLHWKTAVYLCSKFNNILVGNMSTTGIVKRKTSPLSAETKRYAIALSHYKFRERLLSKAEEFGVSCKIVDESYTTQTCGLCGNLHKDIGSNDIFECPQKKCSFIIDRDYNGGRNIYLKTMSKV